MIIARAIAVACWIYGRWQLPHRSRGCRGTALGLSLAFALTGLQLATGLGNVLFDWPLPVAVLHTGGAGALIIIMTWALAASRVERPAHPAPVAHPPAARRV